MPFQTSVKIDPAPAVEGDLATGNPRAAYPAPEGGFIAGAGGVTVGRFVWIQADGKTVLNSGAGKPDGYISRHQQAQINTYLAESGNLIPAGYPVTVMKDGDYWAKSTVAAATRNQKAFAKLADGTMQPANAGATVAGFIETDFVIARTVLVNELTVISK